MFLSQLYQVTEWLLNWPLSIYVLGASVICTVLLRGIQFRYFLRAWQVTLAPSKSSETQTAKGDMTPLQAFINTLSVNLGNGAIVGMATAVYAGGPGAAIWAIIVSFLLMSVRYAEVYISTIYGVKSPQATLGGPMLYLRDVIGGPALAYCYGIFLLLFSLLGGNAVQANSIGDSLYTTWGVPIYVSAIVLLLFMSYVVFGGSQRIVKVSDYLVPVKVGVFFISSFIVLGYHYQSLGSAIVLMIKSAFCAQAVLGGMVGFTVQQAIRFGMARSIFATESGLGTAAVLFGFTGSKDPVSSGLMGMLSTFISTLVCFIVALCLVVSGVWNNGTTGSALTIAAFNTVFGNYGGWIVSFLSITFGLGVAVTFAYITHAAWMFLSKGRYPLVSALLYCLFTVIGVFMTVESVWYAINVTNAGLLLINLFGIVYLLPGIKKDM